MAVKTKERKRSATEERILEIQGRVARWSSLAAELRDVPQAVGAALMTGRHQLLKAIPKGPLTADEAAKVYEILGVLIETNRALQQHAELLAELVEQYRGNLHAVVVAADRLHKAGVRLTDYRDGRSPIAAVVLTASEREVARRLRRQLHLEERRPRRTG